MNGSIAVLRPFDVDPRFLTYWIQGAEIQGRIRDLKEGMGVPHLFQQDIRMPSCSIIGGRRTEPYRGLS